MGEPWSEWSIRHRGRVDWGQASSSRFAALLGFYCATDFLCRLQPPSQFRKQRNVSSRRPKFAYRSLVTILRCRIKSLNTSEGCIGSHSCIEILLRGIGTHYAEYAEE